MTETRNKTFRHIVVFGSSGAIGNALIQQLAEKHPNATVSGISRTQINQEPRQSNVNLHVCNYADEYELSRLSNEFGEQHPCIDLLLIASGVLTAVSPKPEKSVNDITEIELLENIRINAIIPALIFKHFFILLKASSNPTFGALSARIGSISDNRLGGWYAYRMAKAALNMFIKTASLELKRKNKQSVVVGLHPGTVKTKFSERFINDTTKNCFTPEVAATQLINVFSGLEPAQTGKCFAWDGTEIQP